MARDFDGTDDEVTFGSDASIDNFSAFTMAMWIQRDVTDQFDTLLHKEEDAVGGPRWNATHTNVLAFSYQAGGVGDGNWDSAAAVGTGLRHIAVTYDRSSTSNDPSMFLDGAADTVTESSAPTNTTASDAANDLIFGEVRGVLDYDGRMGFLIYHNAIFTAADVNRARWWGCAPGGPSTMKVWQPMWTSDLTNKGTATANGTATGTTMASLPRVERMWGSMMGVGR